MVLTWITSRSAAAFRRLGAGLWKRAGGRVVAGSGRMQGRRTRGAALRVEEDEYTGYWREMWLALSEWLDG